MEKPKRKRCFRRDPRSGTLPYCVSACDQYEECTGKDNENKKE